MPLFEVSSHHSLLAASRKPCTLGHYQVFIQEHNICLIMHTLFCRKLSAHLPKQIVPPWFYNYGNILSSPISLFAFWFQTSLENSLLNCIGNQGRVDFLVDSKQLKGSPWKAQPVLHYLCRATLPCSRCNQLHLGDSTPTKKGKEIANYLLFQKFMQELLSLTS